MKMSKTELLIAESKLPSRQVVEKEINKSLNLLHSLKIGQVVKIIRSIDKKMNERISTKIINKIGKIISYFGLGAYIVKIKKEKFIVNRHNVEKYNKDYDEETL